MSKENATLSFYESLNKKELDSLIDIGWFVFDNFSDYICKLTSGGFDFSKCKGLPRIALITSYLEIVNEISKYNFLFDYIR